MSKTRLEAFSDAVIAIILTIMVLELKVPHGSEWHDLRQVLPHFLTYVLSFVYLGIYWNNHHHMLHATDRITGGILWANLHLLFWLSLIPFATGWMGENSFEAAPAALYGVVLLLCGLSYLILQQAIISNEGRDSRLALAVGRDVKGKLSAVLYLTAIALTFWQRWGARLIYVLVAVMWLIPDRRIERRLAEHRP
jgi:TMEM175 potassium channel family protein